jgi:hypothetical protein
MVVQSFFQESDVRWKEKSLPPQLTMKKCLVTISRLDFERRYTAQETVKFKTNLNKKDYCTKIETEH